MGAIDEMRQSLEALRKRQATRIAYTDDLRMADDAVKVCEAQAVLNPAIDGKNAETRAAQITVLLAADADYHTLRETAAHLRKQVAECDADIEALRYRISAAKAEARLQAASLEAGTVAA